MSDPLRGGNATSLRTTILPSLGYAALAVVLLVLAPMLMGVSWTSAQLFYPDMAGGVVFSGYVALAWAFARPILTLRANPRPTR